MVGKDYLAPTPETLGLIGAIINGTLIFYAQMVEQVDTLSSGGSADLGM